MGNREYIQKLRLEEIKASLPNMSVLELDDDKREVMGIIHNLSDSPVEREHAREIRSLIDKEIDKRIEMHKKLHGQDDDTLTRIHLEQAKQKREEAQAEYEKRQKERKIDEFNRMPFAEQQAYLSSGGVDPNG